MSAPVFRLLSWNILAPEYSVEGLGEVDFYEGVRAWVPWPVRRDRVVEEIRRVDAQIVCLQEVSPEPWTELEGALGPRLAGARLQKRLPRQRDGVATLWHPERVSLEEARLLSFKDGTGYVARLDHLQVGGRPLLVVNAHLKWSPDDRSQPAQMKEIFAALDRAPDLPQIICGDLNIDPRAHEALWAELSGRGFRPAYQERSLTWSAKKSALRLDEILLGPGVECVGVEPLRPIDAETPLPDAQTPSDHLPLCATLRLS